MSNAQSSSEPPGSGAMPPVAGTALAAPPDSGAVPPVAGNVPTALEGTPTAVDASQSASGNGADAAIVDYTPDQGQAESIRILRWPANAYYKILNVEDNASASTIRQAYIRRSVLAHPDHNSRDPQKTDVMQSKWCF